MLMMKQKLVYSGTMRWHAVVALQLQTSDRFPQHAPSEVISHLVEAHWVDIGLSRHDTYGLNPRESAVIENKHRVDVIGM